MLCNLIHEYRPLIFCCSFLTVLKQFMEKVEYFASKAESEDKSNEDVVLHLLQNECTGKEFLSLLEGETKRSASEVALVFSALEAVIVRYYFTFILFYFFVMPYFVFIGWLVI